VLCSCSVWSLGVTPTWARYFRPGAGRWRLDIQVSTDQPCSVRADISRPRPGERLWVLAAGGNKWSHLICPVMYRQFFKIFQRFGACRIRATCSATGMLRCACLRASWHLRSKALAFFIFSLYYDVYRRADGCNSLEGELDDHMDG
jgi:hypothetical protein